MICLNPDLITRLSARGVLAYVAVLMAGNQIMTTAELAALVRTPTSLMLEGLKELSCESPEHVQPGKRGKWNCGTSGVGVVQLLDSSLRFRDLVEDLKKYWDFLNTEAPFSFTGADGSACRRFLADHTNWDRSMWQMALQHRARSVKLFGHASRTQAPSAWVRDLGNYLAGPLNSFGRPVEGMGNAGKAIAVECANSAAAVAYLTGQA